jgi:serine/threonine-protein kinase
MNTVLEGRYRLDGEIARGAIGEVWRAHDTVTGETVAVKLLRPEAAGEADLIAAFIAEAEILADLDHPGVVRPRDFVTGDGGRYALVLDLIESEDLRRRLRRDGPLPPMLAADLVAQIADALAYLHGRGVVHGDVKPANVLAPEGAPVRLVDFGAARRLSGVDPERVTFATPEYVAPEVVDGAVPTPAADVYALGIVLFELMCGRSPYKGGAPVQVLRRHGGCGPVPPPGLPPVVWPVIEQCLAPEAEHRPDAARVAARLRGAAPALDGMPALTPIGAEQVTWWPRPAPATAVARVARPVAWVPLPAAPVSPASAYAGRMVAIPVADLDGARVTGLDGAVLTGPDGALLTDFDGVPVAELHSAAVAAPTGRPDAGPSPSHAFPPNGDPTAARAALPDGDPSGPHRWTGAVVGAGTTTRRPIVVAALGGTGLVLAGLVAAIVTASGDHPTGTPPPSSGPVAVPVIPGERAPGTTAPGPPVAPVAPSRPAPPSGADTTAPAPPFSLPPGPTHLPGIGDPMPPVPRP